MELQWAGIVLSFLTMLIGGAVGYGRLKQEVASERERSTERFDLVRSDLKRLDEKMENLIDYLLRKNGDKQWPR